jgi:tRNA(Leu) C34 or U34 (ribose-2'-O)-methylase TrmL
MRGFACVGIADPKYDGNIGGTIRAASCYDARFVAIAGKRVPHKGRIERTDPRTAHRHMPVLWVDDILAACPHESVPVAIELVKSGTPLPAFEHPASAFYIFGGEDQTLGKGILARCHHVVFVPTVGCMNLAATVNVVLYDRLAKAAP